MTPHRPLLAPAQKALSLGLLLCTLASCQGADRWPVIRTQQWPGPMAATADPLPPGVEGLHATGIEEVLVLRHADPVQVRPAGQPAAFPLFFYDKQRRVNAGSWVFSAPGGRAELIWPSGATLVLFGRCTGVVGSPTRGEPTFIFRELEVAHLHPRPNERFQLLGGAVLEASEGPFRLERRENGVLRVRSQAKVPAEILYRDELFLLDPGQVLDLPLLAASRAPAPILTGASRVPGPGFEVELQGEVDALAREDGVLLVGRGEHEVRALGVRVRVEPGGRILFTGLGSSGSTSGGPGPREGGQGAGDSGEARPTPSPSSEPDEPDPPR